MAVKGVLLAAVDHDANNQIYPFAWDVVQSETGDNWLWFLQQLKVDLNLKDGEGFVLISHKSRGLISSVQTELPKAEHRFCVKLKHIIQNLKNKHPKKDLIKSLIWQLACSYNKTAFKENLNKVKEYNIDVYNLVMKKQPETWSRAFFRLGSNCEYVDNNAT